VVGEDVGLRLLRIMPTDLDPRELELRLLERRARQNRCPQSPRADQMRCGRMRMGISLRSESSRERIDGAVSSCSVTLERGSR